MPKMGLEGIVSKRKDSTYRSGRSPDWFKIITELDLHDRSGQTPSSRTRSNSRCI